MRTETSNGGYAWYGLDALTYQERHIMKTIIVFHGNCFDGFAAAWVLRKSFPDAEFIPAQYGDEPPHHSKLSGTHTIVADFSYKRAVLAAMAQVCSRITVLDHHATAEKELSGLVMPGLSVTFDMGKSGGRLAWEYVWDEFYGLRFSSIMIDKYMTDPNDRDHPPWLVRFSEDRDLWLWKLSDSRAVNAALRTYPTEHAEWDRLADLNPASLVPEGSAILRLESQVVAQHVKHAREITIGGYKVLAVNATTLFSEIAGELAKGRPFGCCYFDRGDGLRVWSLRSRDGGVDVSEVAKQYGGGGHKAAAGFQRTIGEPNV